jgi:hypothetical protein
MPDPAPSPPAARKHRTRKVLRPILSGPALYLRLGIVWKFATHPQRYPDW